jgi:hypothetical protein
MMRLALAALFMFAAMAFLVWDSAPGLWRDYQAKDQFIAASNAQIIKAKCTNYAVFVANRCADFTTNNSKNTQEVSFWRLGRADEGRVRLVQNAREPRMFSTDVAVASLGNRTAFVAVVVLFFSVASRRSSAPLTRSRQADIQRHAFAAGRCFGKCCRL